MKSSTKPGRDKKRDRAIFVPPSYVYFSNQYRIGRRDVIIFVPPTWVWNRAGDSKTFPAGENCKKKTNPSNLIFVFNSTFLLLFINLATVWNQKHECFRAYISYQKSRYAELFLQSASLKLLGMFCIHCYHVTRVFKKPYWRRSFLLFFLVCCCKFICKYFSMF